MARLLGIDWDHNYLRLVEARVHGKTATIERAWLWKEQVSPNPAQAEEAGKRLKERLKEAGVAPAPVRFVIGRDGVICRDLLYPDVPANEVAAVVNFQAAKELSIPPDEAVVDYTVTGVTGPLGEKRALAMIVHKELLSSIQKTCQVAGLKLESVSASSIGHLTNWQAQTGAAATNGSETAGLLVLANGGGELTLIRGGKLLFSRTLSTAGRGNGGAAALVPELRRTLAAFGSQHADAPVRSLNVAGGSTTAEQELLASVLGMPVRAYEPLPAGAVRDIPPTQRGFLAGAAGLVQTRLPLGVDFLSPKKVKPPPSKKPWFYLAAAAAAILVLVCLVIYGMESGRRKEELDKLQADKAVLQKRIKALGEVDKSLEAINNWSGTEIVLLDELYELSARFPDQPGLKITKVQWSPIQTTTTPAPAKAPVALKPPGAPPPKPVARLIIQATGESDKLEKLRAALRSVEHWKEDRWEKDIPNAGTYQATILIFNIAPKDYEGVLGPTTHQTIGMPAPTPARPAGETGGQP